MNLSYIGRWLIAAGALLAICGLLVLAADRLGLKLGRLPGDVMMQRGRATIYAPIMTSLLLSAALTVLLNLFIRWRR